MDISKLSPQQLRKAADLQEKVLELQSQIQQLMGETAAPSAPARKSAGKKSRLSPQGIANIRAGVAKRMLNKAPSVGKPKGKISPAGRRKLALLAKARWAKARAEGRKKL